MIGFPVDKSGVVSYWFPNPFWPPQSGQTQVMPLQDKPQTFSAMQIWQMANPQRQVQENGADSPQQ